LSAVQRSYVREYQRCEVGKVDGSGQGGRSSGRFDSTLGPRRARSRVQPAVCRVGGRRDDGGHGV